MAKIEISEDQNTVTIDGITQHRFVSYDKSATLNEPCNHCSLENLCTENSSIFQCCAYERKDKKSGIYKFKKVILHVPEIPD